MRSAKLFLGIAAFSLMSLTATSATTSSRLSISPSMDVIPTVSKKQQQLMFMKWFVQLSPAAYGKMRGKKLNLFEKLSFRITQYRMKQQLKARRSNDSEGVNWGGLALGFFLGPLGVIGAYLFSKDNNLIKWSWIGCGFWIAIFLIAVVF